jgi:hypothetical protein
LTRPALGCTVPPPQDSVPRIKPYQGGSHASESHLALALVASLALPATVQAQGDYLEVYRVKVKPEKIGDFYALTKKWIDANRQNGGDRWLALETMYGEGSVVQFTSTRRDYADVDKMNEAIMAAAAKAFGADMDKTMVEFEPRPPK